MVDRPRCINWAPLVTQQLRLRNLIQINGHNIECDPDATHLYYTLHATPMSAPFYRSERAFAPHPYPEQKTVVFPEIDCEKMAKSASQCVCVRVWQESPKGDKVLFVWGVYFSGLVPVLRKSEARYRLNSLSFYMHGGLFASADTFDIEYATKVAFPLGLPNFSRNSSSPRSPIVTDKNGTRLSSCDETIRLRSSLSELGSSSDCQQVLAIKSCPELSAFLWNGSPVRSPGVTIDRWELNSIDPRFLKYRYLQIGFKQNDCRPVYSVEKMLAIQERQRILKKKTDINEEECEKIYGKSLYCFDLETATHRQQYIRPQQRHPGMGKTLSRLLYQQEEPKKPEDIIRAHMLKREIETQKFRVKVLQLAHSQQKETLDELNKKLIKVSNKNFVLEHEISELCRTLKRELNDFPNKKTEVDHMRDTLHQFGEDLTAKRRTLLRQLQEIYTIRKLHNGLFTINNVPLPNAESYRNYSVPPADLSVALGFVAHAVIICSSILDKPLRNRIIHEGSVSKIEDNIKPLPPRDRVYPLFCPRNPPSQALLYGVFLLNQNINQIKFDLGLGFSDTRATLANLLDIMNGLEPREKPQQQVQVSSSMDRLSTVSHSITAPISISGDSEKLKTRASHSYDTNKCLTPNMSNSNTTASLRQIVNSAFSNTKRFGSEPALCDQRADSTGNEVAGIGNSSNVSSSSDLILKEENSGKNNL